MDKLLYYNSCVKNLSILRDADLASLHLDYVCPLCIKSFPSEVAKTELTGGQGTGPDSFTSMC